MSRTLAVIIGGAAGALVFVLIVILLVWFCVSRNRSISRTSETGSSDPSIHVGRNVGLELSLRDARRFQMEELYMATKNFSEKNLIGIGKFGEVYKGLLRDGMLVAIKKRPGAPTQEFVNEVRYLSSIQHRNVVILVGYCQENEQQLLVYEYIPNGSVSNHLYGSSQESSEKLEFKLRLSIALGAAKGLAHLHSLSPRLIHKNFKTANVLVDENFIAKVADAGLRNFLGRTAEIAGPSSQVAADEIFMGPEVKEFRRYSDKGDVYSYGVFLLELVTGQEASGLVSGSDQNFVEWVQNRNNLSDFSISTIIDVRLKNNFTTEVMEEFVQLIMRCLDPSSERRPSMSYVEMELNRIYEKEVSLTIVMGEKTPTVTLGSQLFRAS
ncbi:hypothetical protein QQ045_006330 [Rhodiola kirilowii]